MKIAVVILNWNGKTFLERFLPSVVENSPSSEIFVADNGSTDGSVSFLKAKFPQVKIIEFTQNSGFAGGYNRALEKIPADYYILLNSDVEVSKNWIDPVIGIMEENKLIVAAQPKIKAFNDKTKFEYAGAAGGFIDKYGYPFCRGRIFDSIEEDRGQYDDKKEIFWATGACMFVRSEVFHKIGGFDADFFAHMEEIDLCWRFKNSGFKIFYCPGSTVYHIGGGTLQQGNPKKTYLNFRNNLVLLLKNLPLNKLLFVLFLRLILDGLAGIKYIAGGKTADCFAIVKAHFYVYGRMVSIMKKRSNNSLKNLTGIYPRSIVWDYFINGRKNFSDLENF